MNTQPNEEQTNPEGAVMPDCLPMGGLKKVKWAEATPDVPFTALEITHVAVVFNGFVYSLPKPNRHHNVLRAIAEENGIGVDGPHSEGFVDSSGRYLRRGQAMVAARKTGQLNRRPGAQFYQGPELYSEDLW